MSGVRPLPHLLLWAIGLRAAETQTTPAERAALARYAQGRSPIVEIGVWHGVTTACCAKRCAAAACSGRSIRFRPASWDSACRSRSRTPKANRVRNGTIRWVRTTGQAAAAQYEREQSEQVALIFIDGDHSYEGLTGDWFAWKPLIAPGGLVCLHDSRSTPERNIDDAGSVSATKRSSSRTRTSS